MKLKQITLLTSILALLSTLNAYEIIIDKSLTINEKEKIYDILYPSVKDKYGNKYKEIKSPYTRKIWLDRNLGASRVCKSYNDSSCYGDYFQWGRDSDGHEKKNSSTTLSISISSTPNHLKFIISSDRYDWLSSQNNNLWQGENSQNNPCPKGFRIPIIDELLAETVNQGVENNKDAYSNFLKLPSAGYRYSISGSLYGQGSWGDM